MKRSVTPMWKDKNVLKINSNQPSKSQLRDPRCMVGNKLSIQRNNSSSKF